MTNVKAFRQENKLVGFEISGHSGFADEGEDIVCAAISSAAYMSVNTLTEIAGIDLALQLDDESGYLKFLIKNRSDVDSAQIILKGLLLHLEQLYIQYPNNVTVEKTEVKQ